LESWKQIFCSKKISFLLADFLFKENQLNGESRFSVQRKSAKQIFCSKKISLMVKADFLFKENQR
jgi:hypothetical protein